MGDEWTVFKYFSFVAKGTNYSSYITHHPNQNDREIWEVFSLVYCIGKSRNVTIRKILIVLGVEYPKRIWGKINKKPSKKVWELLDNLKKKR